MTGQLSLQLNEAASLLQSGRLDEAAKLVARLKRAHPSIGDVWALDGEIAIRRGRLDEALRSVDRAAELESHLPDRHIQRARCQILAGLTDQARLSAQRSLKSEITRLDHLLVLGGVLVRCNEHTEALRVYLKAAEMAPHNPEVFRALASVYRFLGRLDEAETACDRTLQLDPRDYEIVNLRSSLRTQTRDGNHIDELLRLEAAGISGWRGAVHVAYALAKEYEDVGDYDRSFSCLERGARMKRRHTRYNHADDVRIFETLKSAFTAERLHNHAGRGHASADPIFIVGMPRTGSTLVERIVSAHSQVQSAGELDAFPAEMSKLVREQNGGVLPDRLLLAEAALRLPMHVLGENYLRAVAPLRNGLSKFVDKLPLNCLNIGLIHAALPNAKIVHVVRAPMDACFAMYKYLFKHGYPFSYDLRELAGYFSHYHHLMQHWHKVLPPGRVYDIRYEDVVRNLPGEARKLIAFLGLDWEDTCERSHLNRQAATTGSASQVRQPVYASSVGKWRHFERHLRPLEKALESAGVAID